MYSSDYNFIILHFILERILVDRSKYKFYLYEDKYITIKYILYGQMKLYLRTFNCDLFYLDLLRLDLCLDKKSIIYTVVRTN